MAETLLFWSGVGAVISSWFIEHPIDEQTRFLAGLILMSTGVIILRIRK